jgi:hypothetical protein
MSPKLTQLIEQSAALSPQERLELATHLKSSQNSPDRWDLSIYDVQDRYNDFGAAKVLIEVLDRSKLDRKLSELGMDDETEISRQKNEL